jgi:hypothetical protein
LRTRFSAAQNQARKSESNKARKESVLYTHVLSTTKTHAVPMSRLRSERETQSSSAGSSAEEEEEEEEEEVVPANWWESEKLESSSARRCDIGHKQSASGHTSSSGTRTRRRRRGSRRADGRESSKSKSSRRSSGILHERESVVDPTASALAAVDEAERRQHSTGQLGVAATGAGDEKANHDERKSSPSTSLLSMVLLRAEEGEGLRLTNSLELDVVDDEDPHAEKHHEDDEHDDHHSGETGERRRRSSPTNAKRSLGGVGETDSNPDHRHEHQRGRGEGSEGEAAEDADDDEAVVRRTANLRKVRTLLNEVPAVYRDEAKFNPLPHVVSILTTEDANDMRKLEHYCDLMDSAVDCLVEEKYRAFDSSVDTYRTILGAVSRAQVWSWSCLSVSCVLRSMCIVDT